VITNALRRFFVSKSVYSLVILSWGYKPVNIPLICCCLTFVGLFRMLLNLGSALAVFSLVQSTVFRVLCVCFGLKFVFVSCCTVVFNVHSCAVVRALANKDIRAASVRPTRNDVYLVHAATQRSAHIVSIRPQFSC